MTPGEPLVSVVIASVNGLPAIGACLDALAGQNGGAVAEILVVDRCGEETRSALRARFPAIAYARFAAVPATRWAGRRNGPRPRARSLNVASSSPDSASARSNSSRAFTRARNSIICTRLCALTALSPVVSIGMKIASGHFAVTNDCTPSLTPDEGMQPNGFTETTMFAFLCLTVITSLPTSMCASPPRTLRL